MAPTTLGPTDALLLVDVQNDFCPGGALPVPGGHDIVPVLNRWIAAAQAAGAGIYASRDWHPPNHVSFQSRGGPWPAHCIQDTRGAEFHPDLRLPLETTIVSKGISADRDSYSAFEDTGLAEKLRAARVERLWIGGLAQDICVAASVADALRAGLEVHLLEAATRPVNVRPDDGARALDQMRAAGAILETDPDPPENHHA